MPPQLKRAAKDEILKEIEQLEANYANETDPKKKASAARAFQHVREMVAVELGKDGSGLLGSLQTIANKLKTGIRNPARYEQKEGTSLEPIQDDLQAIRARVRACIREEKDSRSATGRTKRKPPPSAKRHPAKRAIHELFQSRRTGLKSNRITNYGNVLDHLCNKSKGAVNNAFRSNADLSQTRLDRLKSELQRICNGAIAMCSGKDDLFLNKLQKLTDEACAMLDRITLEAENKPEDEDDSEAQVEAEIPSDEAAAPESDPPGDPDGSGEAAEVAKEQTLKEYLEEQGIDLESFQRDIGNRLRCSVRYTLVEGLFLDDLKGIEFPHECVDIQLLTTITSVLRRFDAELKKLVERTFKPSRTLSSIKDSLFDSITDFDCHHDELNEVIVQSLRDNVVDQAALALSELQRFDQGSKIYPTSDGPHLLKPSELRPYVMPGKVAACEAAKRAKEAKIIWEAYQIVGDEIQFLIQSMPAAKVSDSDRRARAKKVSNTSNARHHAGLNLRSKRDVLEFWKKERILQEQLAALEESSPAPKPPSKPTPASAPEPVFEAVEKPSVPDFPSLSERRKTSEPESEPAITTDAGDEPVEAVAGEAEPVVAAPIEAESSAEIVAFAQPTVPEPPEPADPVDPAEPVDPSAPLEAPEPVETAEPVEPADEVPEVSEVSASETAEEDETDHPAEPPAPAIAHGIDPDTLRAIIAEEVGKLQDGDAALHDKTLEVVASDIMKRSERHMREMAVLSDEIQKRKEEAEEAKSDARQKQETIEALRARVEELERGLKTSKEHKSEALSGGIDMSASDLSTALESTCSTIEHQLERLQLLRELMRMRTELIQETVLHHGRLNPNDEILGTYLARLEAIENPKEEGAVELSDLKADVLTIASTLPPLKATFLRICGRFSDVEHFRGLSDADQKEQLTLLGVALPELARAQELVEILTAREKAARELEGDWCKLQEERTRAERFFTPVKLEQRFRGANPSIILGKEYAGLLDSDPERQARVAEIDQDVRALRRSITQLKEALIDESRTLLSHLDKAKKAQTILSHLQAPKGGVPSSEASGEDSPEHNGHVVFKMKGREIAFSPTLRKILLAMHGWNSGRNTSQGRTADNIAAVVNATFEGEEITGTEVSLVLRDLSVEFRKKPTSRTRPKKKFRAGAKRLIIRYNDQTSHSGVSERFLLSHMGFDAIDELKAAAKEADHAIPFCSLDDDQSGRLKAHKQAQSEAYKSRMEDMKPKED